MRLHNETNYDIRVLQQKIIGNLEAIDRACREHGHGPRSWLPWLLHKTFSLAWLQRKVRSYMVKYDYEQSAYVCDYDDGLRGCIEKRLLSRFSITSSAST